MCVCNTPYCQRRKKRSVWFLCLSKASEFCSFDLHVFWWMFMFFLLSAHVGDICIPNPCLNGGTCQTQGLLGFTCQCRTGFQGLTCQICECFVCSICLLIQNSNHFSIDIYFYCRRCLCTESMSKWRFMHLRWTNRIFSMLLSSWIHRTHLWCW